MSRISTSLSYDSASLVQIASLAGLLLCAACSSKLGGPTPELTSKPARALEPGLVCGDQLTTELTLSGKGFSPVTVNASKTPTIALPSLTLLRSHALDGAAANEVKVLYGGDPNLANNTAALSWDSQQQMKFTVNQALNIDGQQGRLPAGVYDLRIENPNGKQVGANGVLAVLDKPAISALSPALVCLSERERELSLTGSGFLKLTDALPQVSVDSVDMAFDNGALEDCAAIAQQGLNAELCGTLRLSLPKQSVAPGLHAVTLTNPPTAACHSEEQLQLRIVPAPVISTLAPNALCTLDAQHKLVIQGEGFLQVDAAQPVVKLAGQTVSVSALSNCQDLETSGSTVKSCRQIELDVDVTSLALGDVAIEVTNPEPAGCGATANGVLRVAGPPAITAVSPSSLCSDVMATITVTGSGFDAGATAQIDASNALVKYVSPTELQLTAAGLSAGSHVISVHNAQGCGATLSAALTVAPSPIVFFVDPPATYGKIPVEISVFTSGLSAAASKVELVRGDMRENLSFASATAPNKILAQVKAGLREGAWDVVVTDMAGCPGTLPGGLAVHNTLSDSLVRSIRPSYASTSEATAVTISGSGLAPVPRVYLSASGATGSAQALRAVAVKAGGAALTAVIPQGLAPSTYDLIVVNPDGKVDVLAGGVTITADKPPVISAVTPASLPANASGVPITIAGSGFKTGLSVELDCLTKDGMRTTVPTTEQAPSGDGKTVVVNVTLANAAPDAVSAGSVCLVRLTNADGAFFEYSAFSITNSSLNLGPWQEAKELQTARRALSLLAGRPTATSRYLYALGGDNGVDNAPNTRGTRVFDSVESSQVDVFGAMSDWTAQRSRLPAPRTAAGAASIGRFVYVVGGHDGASATNTLYRASILDPLEGPVVSAVDAALSDGTTGLVKGLYYYQIAALHTANDLANPAGESLAGELLPVQLPDRPEKIALTLTWGAVPGAHGYRVYRSPMANAAANRLELLGEVTCGAANAACDCAADASRCRWRDDGNATQVGRTPLPAGSLGVWHAVSGGRCRSADCLLGSAREGLSAIAVNNPDNQSQWYLYAFGGRDQAGSYLDSYEVATVNVANDGGQTVSDFAAGAHTLEVPRADHGVWAMSKSNSNVIASSGSASDVWVYVGGGRTTAGATDSTLEAGKLGANGILSAFVATDGLKGSLVGFSTGAANDQLYTFGGIPGAADGTSAKLCDGSGGCGPLPDLKAGAWNALGSATTQRMFAGSTQESAFFFLVGGHDGSNTLKTSQSAVQ
jgi:hypothetical protein